MDNRKNAITTMMVLSVLGLFIGTLGISCAAAEEPIPGLPGEAGEAGIRATTDGSAPLGSSNMPGPCGNLFEQPPHGPSDTWASFTSAYDPSYPADYLVYENFWNVTGDICDLHWYGKSGTPVWERCDPEGMIFDITFYANNATGMPGEIVCSYENVSPKISYYSDFPGYLEGYYFETDLNPCCQLRDGWVSIQSQGSDNGCWFLWLSSAVGDGSALQENRITNTIVQTDYDLAFTLTSKAEVPALTPTGLIALVGMLMAIAAVAIVRKRR